MTSVSAFSPEFIRSNPAPKVTVCVVTYNQKDFIAQCLQSLVDQETDFPFEILVGDDCSTDGTSKIIADFVDRYPGVVVHLRHSPNVGPYENYRYVHSLARGQFVAHLDGDDYILPGKLRIQSEFMDMNTDCVLSGHDVFLLNSNGSLREQRKNIPEISGACSFLRYGNFLCHSSTMYRRGFELTDDLGASLLDFQIHVARVAQGLVGYISEPLGVYRLNSAGMVVSTYGKSLAMYHRNIQALDQAGLYCGKKMLAEIALIKLAYRWELNFISAGSFKFARDVLLSLRGGVLMRPCFVVLWVIYFFRHLVRRILLLKRRLVR